MTETISDDALIEDAWLAAPRQRSRLRVVLVGLLAGSVFFLGGVVTQKYLGDTGEGGAGAASGPGGLPGGGQLPEGFSFPQGGEPPERPLEPDAAAPGEGDATDSVIGTVVAVRGNTWVVEDLGGERHRIRIDDDVQVTRETTLDPGRVNHGQLVDITGTTSDGRLRAEDVTVR